MSEQNEQLRAEFEVWAKAENYDMDARDGIYESLLTAAAWEGFQAARRAQPAPTVQAEQMADERDESVEADAYVYACELMESGWRERAKRGVEVGTQGSLCDGISWIFERMKKLESAAPAHASSDGRDAILEEAAELCESLRVKVETSRPYSGEQEARNDGLDEAAEAIRALAGTGVKGDES